MRRNVRQADLFGGAFQPRRHPHVGREPRLVYRAVMILRVMHYKVYRCGSNHMVDGKMLTTDALLLLARNEQTFLRWNYRNEPWRSHYALIKSI